MEQNEGKEKVKKEEEDEHILVTILWAGEGKRKLRRMQ